MLLPHEALRSNKHQINPLKADVSKPWGSPVTTPGFSSISDDHDHNSLDPDCNSNVFFSFENPSHSRHEYGIIILTVPGQSKTNCQIIVMAVSECVLKTLFLILLCWFNPNKLSIIVVATMLLVTIILNEPPQMWCHTCTLVNHVRTHCC